MMFGFVLKITRSFLLSVNKNHIYYSFPFLTVFTTAILLLPATVQCLELYLLSLLKFVENPGFHRLKMA